MNLPGDRQSGEPPATAPANASAERGCTDNDAGRHAATAGADQDAATGSADQDAAAAAARHRLAQQIAEDLLPESADDERQWGDRDNSYSAAWYAENRPPHHDR
jgi:hypothetical protein